MTYESDFIISVDLFEKAYGILLQMTRTGMFCATNDIKINIRL